MKAFLTLLTRTQMVPATWLVALFTVVSLGMTSCQDKCKTTVTYKSYEPVYMLREDLRSAVEALPARTLEQPGKIYVRDNFLFVNEINKGIHVIDNSNPASPQVISFINIPGNVDIAVKNNILYADSYIDLVALDISNPNQVELIKRVENVFPSYGYEQSTTILVDYKEKWVTQTLNADCGSPNVVNRGPQPHYFYADKALSSAAPNTPGSASKPGIGGSMARFTIYDRYLYTVSYSDMQLFDITTPTDPQKATKIGLGNWNIETIFPYKDKLFIGSQNGMHIYDNKNPANPELLSTYQHVQSCDPVVVEDNYAYVTLRSGTACQGFTNQLEVLDISNLRAPSLVKTYPMQHPHGLGIDRSTLFICEGEYGLKVFDAKNVQAIDQNLLAHFKDKDAYDVIALGHILLVIGKDGLYQYDYSNPKDLKLLSVIPVIQP